MQAGALLLGGSALFRTNGLTQFGARHMVSRVGGDPFSNTDEKAGSVQLPIALWQVSHMRTRMPPFKCRVGAHWVVSLESVASTCRTRPGDDAATMIAEFLTP